MSQKTKPNLTMIFILSYPNVEFEQLFASIISGLKTLLWSITVHFAGYLAVVKTVEYQITKD